jgi:hypothetical protein
MEELNKLTDDQIETELKTIQAKAEQTPEEKEKLTGLKEERQTRYQKRIDKLSSEKKLESERARRLEEELQKQKAELDEIKAKQQVATKPVIIEDHVEYGGKKFYTDDSLMSMVDAQELTRKQAYDHQQQRLKAEIKDEIEKEKKQNEEKTKFQEEFENDKKAVLKEYPQFNPSHPDHNPEDALYKLSSEIFVEGYRSNPRGLSLAINRARQILRLNDARPDTTDIHSVGGNSGGSSQPEPAQVSEFEKEISARLYMNVVNPATGRFYTENEAINKMIKAKQAKIRR